MEAAMILQPMNLKSSDRVNEQWVQEQLRDHPELLGFGDVEVLDT